MSYQTVYNIGLLDDLHNYFPDILYNRSRFQSTPQLLEYIQHQILTRVNPFMHGASLYREARYPGLAHAEAASNPLVTPPRVAQQPAALPPPVVRQRPAAAAPRAPVVADMITETYDLSSLFNLTTIPPLIPTPIDTQYRAQAQSLGALGDILNLLGAFPRTAGIPPDMTPVVVRPTQDDIDSGAPLRAATSSEEEEACSICQDNYTEGQAVRELSHCNHVFHRNCIETWFQQNVHCPVCRHDIREAFSENSS